MDEADRKESMAGEEIHPVQGHRFAVEVTIILSRLVLGQMRMSCTDVSFHGSRQIGQGAHAPSVRNGSEGL